MPYKNDDIELLLPSFKPRVAAVIAALTAEGFDVCLRDTLRTSAESAHNAEMGFGIAHSMHEYGAAADLICQKHGWDCAKNRCSFFVRLGVHVKAGGSVWGGDFKRGGKGPDMPHMQGVAIGQQNALRALGVGPENAGRRDSLVRAFYSAKPSAR